MRRGFGLHFPRIWRVKLLTILYIIGITAEGMTGALAAGRHNMDWFGVLFIACVTALGGGSIRDVLFGMYPLTWVAHPEYLAIICISALLTMKIPYFVVKFERTFLLLDALGLAVFSVIGARVGLDLHPSGVMAITGAIITGIFGGILRDIFCARIPLVFQKELYASVALLVGGLYVAFYFINTHYRILSENSIILICIAVGFSARLIAIRYHLGLPTFKFQN